MQKRTRLGLHGGFPQLLGVHLAQTFVTLNVVLVGIIEFGHELVFSFIVVDVLQNLARLGVLLFQTVQRGLRDIDIAAIDEVGHIAIEERQQQNANMRTVDIGIGHDDDAMVAGRVAVVIFADIRANCRNKARNGVARKCAMQTSTLDVQNFATEGQNCLVFAVTRLLGRTTCGITLDDEDFRQGGIFARAVGKLARHAERIEHALAARHFASFAGGLSRFKRLGRLANDAFGWGGVLLEVFREALRHGTLHQTANLGVAELGFRLTLELWIMQLHTHDSRQTLTGVVAGKVAVLFLQDGMGASVFVDRTREGILKTIEMRAALVRVDVVCKREHTVSAVAR